MTLPDNPFHFEPEPGTRSLTCMSHSVELIYAFASRAEAVIKRRSAPSSDKRAQVSGASGTPAGECLFSVGSRRCSCSAFQAVCDLHQHFLKDGSLGSTPAGQTIKKPPFGRLSQPTTGTHSTAVTAGSDSERPRRPYCPSRSSMQVRRTVLHGVPMQRSRGLAVFRLSGGMTINLPFRKACGQSRPAVAQANPDRPPFSSAEMRRLQPPRCTVSDDR